jgi:hypothetical protein
MASILLSDRAGRGYGDRYRSDPPIDIEHTFRFVKGTLGWTVHVHLSGHGPERTPHVRHSPRTIVCELATVPLR